MTLRPPRTLDPTTLLRVGIGLVYVYAGALSLVDPGTFEMFLPEWLSAAIPAEAFVLGHGILSAALGILLVSGAWIPGTALAVALDLAAILLAYGIDATTFPLIGLMFAALALSALAGDKKETVA